MMATVSLDSPSCEVPCLILHSVVYRDVTRQAKGLYYLKYVGTLERGLAYLSRCNSGWFCHNFLPYQFQVKLTGTSYIYAKLIGACTGGKQIFLVLVWGYVGSRLPVFYLNTHVLCMVI
jgi:hypothetical protein